MKERPILMSARMVNALLQGGKTQTRRLVKPQPEWKDMNHGWWWRDGIGWSPDTSFRKYMPTYCPYGQPGDRLWVRETWAYVPITAYRGHVYQQPDPNDPDMAAVYRADWERVAPRPWKPSIFMPRWASRIDLTITDIRVERVQDITEDDAIAEGCIGVLDYSFLWNEINSKHPWKSNPWVWVITFEVHD